MKRKWLKASLILAGIFILIYGAVVLLSYKEKVAHADDQELIGSFCVIDSPKTILHILAGNMFILENRINEKYNGDGNWETIKDTSTQLVLWFENGESLNFRITPQKDELISDNIANKTIRLRRINTHE